MMRIVSVALATSVSAVAAFEDDFFFRALASHNTTAPQNTTAPPQNTTAPKTNTTAPPQTTMAPGTQPPSNQTEPATDAATDAATDPATEAPTTTGVPTVEVSTTGYTAAPTPAVGSDLGGITVTAELAAALEAQAVVPVVTAEAIPQAALDAMVASGEEVSVSQSMTLAIEIEDPAVFAAMFESEGGEAATGLLTEVGKLITGTLGLGADSDVSVRVTRIIIDGTEIDIPASMQAVDNAAVRRRKLQESNASAMTFDYEATGDAGAIVSAVKQSTEMTPAAAAALAGDLTTNIAANPALATLNMTVGGIFVTSSPIYIPTTTAAPSGSDAYSTVPQVALAVLVGALVL